MVALMVEPKAELMVERKVVLMVALRD